MAQAILLADVEGLGENGTAIEVSPGYLRNYLQPRGLAQPATPGALEEAIRRKEAAEVYARILPLINYENRQCGLRACKTVMMEGGVIKSDAVRHPLEALHPATKAGLLELARDADVLALRWGK